MLTKPLQWLAKVSISSWDFGGNGGGWPEQYGTDNGELAALKSAGIYLVAGGDYHGNTSNYSVASALALAAKDNALSTLIGYDLGDEPTCGEAPGQMGAVPGNVATVAGYDPTRVTVWNMLPFVPWEVGASFYGTCNGSYSEPNAAFLAPSIASFDNYPGIVSLVYRPIILRQSQLRDEK